MWTLLETLPFLLSLLVTNFDEEIQLSNIVWIFLKVEPLNSFKNSFNEAYKCRF